MKYDFTKISLNQKKLDNYILDKMEIEINKDRYWNNRIIALNVELNELINEIKFFKYWKKNKEIDQNKINEEFIDCLHFLFSIGNTLGYEKWIFITDDFKRPIELIYFDLTKNILMLLEEKSTIVFGRVFKNLIEIAWELNLTNEQIHEIYSFKNKVNYERQDNNY